MDGSRPLKGQPLSAGNSVGETSIGTGIRIARDSSARVVRDVTPPPRPPRQRSAFGRAEDLKVVHTALDGAAALMNDRLKAVLLQHSDQITARYRMITGTALDFDPVVAFITVSANAAKEAWSRLGMTTIADMADHIRKRRSGAILYGEQTESALDLMVKQIISWGLSGTLLGAMQVGKTGTIYATLATDAILHAAFGVAFAPFIVVSEQTSHSKQGVKGLDRFLELYRGLEFVPVRRQHKKPGTFTFFDLGQMVTKGHENGSFERGDAITLDAHLNEVQIGKQLYYRRVRGEGEEGDGIDSLIADMDEAVARGLYLHVRLDESHHGATGKNMKALFAGKHDEIWHPSNPHRVTAVSATPFSHLELPNMVVTKMRLSPHYRGFNFANGEVLDPNVVTSVPDIVRLGSLPIPGAAQVQTAFKDAWDGAIIDPVGFDGACRTLREIMDYMMHGRGPVGCCVRIVNDNALINEVAVRFRQIGGYEVLIFNGESDHRTVDELLESRTQTDLPFVILVTGKARMGDDFAPITEVFIELTERTTYSATAVQGLVGRACGHYKPNSVLVMSDYNADMVEHYIETLGKPRDFAVGKDVRMESLAGGRVRTPSAYYITREAATKVAALGRDYEGLLRAFLRADREFVCVAFPKKVQKIAREAKRHEFPLFDIFEEEGVWDLLDRPEVQRLIEGTRFRPVKPGESHPWTLKEREVTLTMPALGEPVPVFFRHMTKAMADADKRSFVDADHRGYEDRATRSDKDATHGTFNVQFNVAIVDDAGVEMIPASTKKKVKKGQASRLPTKKPGRVALWAISLPCDRTAGRTMADRVMRPTSDSYFRGVLESAEAAGLGGGVP